MLPHSIELHLQIASPSLIGLPCELGIVHFTQAIYPELLKRKKRKRNMVLYKDVSFIRFISTQLGYVSTVMIHYWLYFKKSNKRNSIRYVFFPKSSKKSEERSIQIKALKIVLEKHIHWVMNSSIFQDE